MSLKKEFLTYVENNPRHEESYTTLPKSGIDIEWNDLLNAWKIDMGMDVNEFLDRNPEIHQNLIEQGVLKEGEKITPRTLHPKGGDLIPSLLDEIVKATDVGERTAFKGHQLRNVGTGTLSGQAKNELYINAVERGNVGGGSHNWEILPNRSGVVYNPLKYYNYKRYQGNKKSYIQASRDYLQEHGSLKGFTKEHGFYVEAGKVSMVRRRERSEENPLGRLALADITSKASSEYYRNLYAKDQTLPGVTKPELVKGLEPHHKALLGQIAPWLKGLNEKEKAEFVRWAYDEGYALGDDPKNIDFLSKFDHDKIHKWMLENRIQLGAKAKSDVFGGIESLSLNERFVPFLLYMENVVNPGIQASELIKNQRLQETSQDLSLRSVTNELARKIGIRAATNLIPFADATMGTLVGTSDLAENDRLSAMLAGTAGAVGETGAGEWLSNVIWTARDLNELSQVYRGFDTTIRGIPFEEDVDLDQRVTITYDKNQHENLNIDNNTRRAIGLEPQPEFKINGQLQSSLPFDHTINTAPHKKQMKKTKIYNKGIRTDNPNEADTFLKRTGPQLPLPLV